MNPGKKRALFLLGLAGLFCVFLFLSLAVGPARTQLEDLWRFLFHHETTYRTIFLDLRLSRALVAFLVGACLSLSGAILQGFFQNPMADPFVVGVSSGASFGAVLCLVLGLESVFLGFSMQPLFAFASAFGLVSVVYFLSQKKAALRVETLLLTGIAAGAVASAMTSFLLFSRSDSFEQAVFWLLGSFALAEWRQAAALALVFAFCFAVAEWLAKDMNLLALGDEAARSLGSPVGVVRRAFLAISTLLAAVSVAVSGVIGFVGLVVPHWVRLLLGPDHRYLFAFSSLTGGTFLIICDLLARTVLAPAELPVGIITAAVGGPFFISLLYRRR